MITLSQLHLNPLSQEVARDLADCQRLHVRVMSVFPDLNGNARRGLNVLHRLESVPQTGRIRLLVQAQGAVDWSTLPNDYLEPGTDTSTKRVDALYSAIAAGDILQFRLRANATKRVAQKGDPTEGRWTGRRIPVRGESGRLEWLRRKGEQVGFALVGTGLRADVPDVRVFEEPDVIGCRRSETGPGSRITLSSTVFEGRLRVLEPESFRDALVQGIGPAKAYGFGLLSVGR